MSDASLHFASIWTTFLISTDQRNQQYFEEYYATKCGNINEMYTGPLILHCSIHYTEKWAMSFRNFDHSDADTNMHIERYVI